jgi:CRISPR/Cas system CSM-associated protein Csm2 small subunit
VAAAALKKAQDEAAEAERKRLKKIEDDKQERAMNKFKTFAKYVVSLHN